LEFYRRHYSGIGLATALLTMRTGMALRLVRDLVRYAAARTGSRRGELADDIGVWRRTLATHDVRATR
jgi:hypothetical protein